MDKLGPDKDDVIAHLSPLRRYARALTRDEARADDLVQDALARAFERRATFRAGTDLRNWLLSILHNLFVDDCRRREAEARRATEIAKLAEVSAPAGQESRLHLQQIGQAFLALPREQRAVLHLVAIEGLSYQEAADALGIAVGTLMSRLSRARAALRAFEAGAQGPMRALPPPAAAASRRPNLRIVGGSDD
jgi:RNA polymerase sigma-70 factor (ECF subfamily)